MRARFATPPVTSTRCRAAGATAAVLAGATALVIALPASPAGAATPAFGASAGAVSATVDTTFLQGSGPNGAALASVKGVFGQSLAAFDPAASPQAQASAVGFLGTSSSNGTETQLASVGAGQSAPPANADPVSGSAKALTVSFPGGDSTFFDTSAVRYTASARPVDSSSGQVASATTTGASFDTLPQMPGPGSTSASQAAAVAKTEAQVADAMATAKGTSPAAVQVGGFFPSAASVKTSSTVSIANVGTARASVATASAQASTFTAGGFTFVVPAGSVTATATGTASTSSVAYQAPKITYSGPGVASGTPLPAAGVTLSQPGLTVSIRPGAVQSSNSGSVVTAGVSVLTASITITDGTTTLLSSTTAIGTLAVVAAATAAVPPTSTPSGPGSTPSGPVLANTGADTHGLPIAGAGLVVVGAAVLVLARRRRPSTGSHAG